MNAVVLRGDARALPLPDASVDLIVTSPPYFGLRSYMDNVKCYECIQMEYNGRDPQQAWPDYAAHVRDVHIQHYDGQVGSEATPQEWLAVMTVCAAEMARVLKPSGSIFLNVGDKYSQRTQTRRSSHQPGIFPGKFPEFGETWAERAAKGAVRMPHQNVINDDGMAVAEKSLMGLPWRLALACTDQLGLILRRDIIWSKPNGLPESVTDRCRSSHEYLFHLVKQPRYYAAIDEIREEHSPISRQVERNSYRAAEAGGGYTKRWDDGTNRQEGGHGHVTGTRPLHPLGKLPGSVWSIPSQPLTVPAHLNVDHFAAFPMELPRRCILGWSPPGICAVCGEGRRPVVKTPRAFGNVPECNNDGAIAARGGAGSTSQMRLSGSLLHKWRQANPAQHLGYACACPASDAPTRPSLVLDPFGGTGTTALVASMLGRTGVSIDRSMDYTRLARWRVTDPSERARAMQVPKPPPVPAGQVSLFDLDAS